MTIGDSPIAKSKRLQTAEWLQKKRECNWALVKTRINIGKVFEKWFIMDAETAIFLLDRSIRREQIITHKVKFLLLFVTSELGSLSWDDLENDLPDELIPNGDLGMMSMSSNGGATGGHGPMVPDTAAKHKQLSELLRPGSSAGMNSAGPQTGGIGPQLGGLGKSPLGQGSPSHPSQTQKPGGTPGTQGNNAGSAGMGLGTGFNQAMLNSGMMAQNAAGQPGQVINGTLGSVGRGRGAPGMQYQGGVMQVAPSVGAGGAGGPAAPGGAGSVLAETLTQGAQQMGINTQQAGNINKVRWPVSFAVVSLILSHEKI
ncbi:hypothetical protein cypCar_00012457 [Cyprinus carpio]|nr:hypothetical protein cypCar_00012457 [Cyprinus carpio]